MKTIKKNNHAVALVIVAAALMCTASCKKEIADEHLLSSSSDDQAALKKLPSPWRERSSGISVPERAIGEMSEPDQTTCYGLIYDNLGVTPLHDITITHDGGKTWHSQTIAGLENNIPYGVAATTAKTAHVFGWNYVSGGGNVFRTSDGGKTWQREAANAFTDPASFPDALHFFDPKNGVMFGDPQNGHYEIYITCNGGNSWSRVPSKNIPAPLPNEYGVPYHSDIYNNTIWMMTSTLDSTGNPVSSRLLQSDDRGATWYVRNSYLTFNGYDCSIKFRNHSVGLYKNNGILYRTTNGGKTWKVVNYSGTWFSYDLDNVPGKAGWWISTGGGTEGNPLSVKGFGSSISYDDGDHWITLDTAVNHTCVDMTSPTHGYSGGVTTGSGDDGVFVYSFPHLGLNSVVSAGDALTNNQKVNLPKPSDNIFLPGNKFAALRHYKNR